MKVLFLNAQHELRPHPQVVTEIEALINEELERSGTYFSHMEIDGQLVYQDHEQYVMDNLHHIDTIKICLMSAIDYRNQALIDGVEYLNKFQPELTGLINQFQKNPVQETWNTLADLFEALQWMNQFATALDHELISNLKYRLVDLLPLLEQAVKDRDLTLIVDLLLYEISPLVQEVRASVQAIIDSEVIRHDLN
jgi:hypothetical protein